MAVPKRRTTSTKRNMRRSHHFKKPLKLTLCTKCGAAILPHMACMTCGTYKGREVVNVLKKLDKKERKAKEQARSRQE